VYPTRTTASAELVEKISRRSGIRVAPSIATSTRSTRVADEAAGVSFTRYAGLPATSVVPAVVTVAYGSTRATTRATVCCTSASDGTARVAAPAGTGACQAAKAFESQNHASVGVTTASRSAPGSSCATRTPSVERQTLNVWSHNSAVASPAGPDNDVNAGSCGTPRSTCVSTLPDTGCDGSAAASSVEAISRSAGTEGNSGAVAAPAVESASPATMATAASAATTTDRDRSRRAIRES
jgi:hypothetical protein